MLWLVFLCRKWWNDYRKRPSLVRKQFVRRIMTLRWQSRPTLLLIRCSSWFPSLFWLGKPIYFLIRAVDSFVSNFLNSCFEETNDWWILANQIWRSRGRECAHSLLPILPPTTNIESVRCRFFSFPVNWGFCMIFGRIYFSVNFQIGGVGLPVKSSDESFVSKLWGFVSGQWTSQTQLCFHKPSCLSARDTKLVKDWKILAPNSLQKLSSLFFIYVQ